MKTRLNSLVGVFIFLLIAKIIVSGLYLQRGAIRVSTSSLALAEDKNAAAISSDPSKDLKDRASQLQEREKILKLRELELIPLKKEIEAKVADLNELQNQLAAFAEELAEREKALNDAKITHVVSLYSAMEPARAAAIMDKLKIETLVRILGNMKGKSAGQILAAMDPDKGALISEKLSELD